jgi:hypothetical protein
VVLGEFYEFRRWRRRICGEELGVDVVTEMLNA